MKKLERKSWNEKVKRKNYDQGSVYCEFMQFILNFFLPYSQKMVPPQVGGGGVFWKIFTPDQGVNIYINYLFSLIPGKPTITRKQKGNIPKKQDQGCIHFYFIKSFPPPPQGRTIATGKKGQCPPCNFFSRLAICPLCPLVIFQFALS